MKDVAIGALACIVVALVVFGAIYGLRLFSQATTPVTIVEPESGIHCALAVTSDGAAIDCWKVEP